jgi:DNA primase
MGGIDFRTLRCQVGLGAVLELLGFVATQRCGGQLRGACPLHPRQMSLSSGRSPRNRSFSANLQKNAYHCFHCGSTGNQLDLWAAATHQPLYQAAIELCDKLHRPVPWLKHGQTSQRKPAPAS